MAHDKFEAKVNLLITTLPQAVRNNLTEKQKKDLIAIGWGHEKQKDSDDEEVGF